MEQEFYLLWGEKSRHYKSSKSLEQSKCICCRGDTQYNNISTANSFEADFDSIIQERQNWQVFCEI
jgi:hypothetical protein